jgi:hypothetical protein
MGSDTLILTSYQLDFVTPGMSPSLASLRKQRRHISYFRKKPLGLPQIRQRFTFRVLYFGVRSALIIIAFLAIYHLLPAVLLKRAAFFLLGIIRKPI